MKTYVLVALGAGLGGMARHGVTNLVAGILGREFPYGTLIVNVSGALLIGIASMYPNRNIDALWIIGVLGGYTTFSAFSLQTLGLLQENRLVAASSYVLASVAICLLAVWLGQLLGRSIFTAPN